MDRDRAQSQLGRRSQAIRSARIGWALCCTALVLLTPIVGPRTAQPASRYALAAAIADDGSVDVGRFASVLGVDHAIFEGRWRSDKGPGQPVLAAGAYKLARVFGAGPLDASSPVRGDLMLWWLTFVTALVPFAVLLMLTYRRAARAAPATALVAAVSVLAGSIILPHAVNLYAHTLSALLGFGAYIILDVPVRAMESPTTATPIAWPRLVASGIFVGAAIATEYHLAIVAVALTVVVFRRSRFRGLVLFAVGSLAPLAGLAIYQWRAFGAFWRTPFAYYAGEIAGTTEGGYSLPTLRGIEWLTIGNRGLLISGPILVIAVGCAVWQLRTRANDLQHRADCALGVSVMVGYALLVAGWSGSVFLEEPGPRYLIPAIPFLVVPLALSWNAIRRIARPAAVWGAILMIAATVTVNLVPHDESIVAGYVRYIQQAKFRPTIWSMAFGGVGIWLYVASALLALRWLWQSAKTKPHG